MDNVKTIRGPKAVLDQWLADLRSGKFKQGTNALSRGGYNCCLGVLLVGQGKATTDPITGEDAGLPTIQQLQEMGVEFTDAWGCSNERTPDLLCDHNEGSMSADLLNDRGYTFPQIADLIEKRMEYTDGE